MKVIAVSRSSPFGNSRMMSPSLSVRYGMPTVFAQASIMPRLNCSTTAIVLSLAVGLPGRIGGRSRCPGFRRRQDGGEAPERPEGRRRLLLERLDVLPLEL